MVEKNRSTQLKGSPIWALTYAITSIRNYPIRNMGIAVVLAIGIALPTTVFVWADTGTTMVVHNYFEEATYQMSLRLKSSALYDWTILGEILASASNHPLTEYAHRVISTVGVLSNETLPYWGSYDIYGLNYLYGVKDCRAIFVENYLLANWSQEFDFQGKFSLEPGEILVSQGFIDYTNEVHGIQLRIGDQIDIDLITHEQRNSGRNQRSELIVSPVENLTIAGIYQAKLARSQLIDAFPSISRKNWDPLALDNDLVLGVDDSVMILSEDVTESLAEEIGVFGYFKFEILIRASESALLQGGAINIGDNLVKFKTQFEETYPTYQVSGLRDIWRVESAINTFLQSQILTVVAFPVLIMSLMLTVFTSETSVSRRKGEISALRSKGASFNQVFATFMWESLFLGFIGLALGIGMSFVLGPLIGSSTNLFMFDFNLYGQFAENLSISPLALIIAIAIAMYLPAAYLLHVARRIDVSEVGQPISEQAEEGAEMGSIWRYAVGLGVVLSALMVLPMIVSPSGTVAVGQILISTLLLFVASYLGSRTMRLVTAKLSGSTNFLLGEKSLYLSQSLRKRKGQFIPLLVILTITLTTTTMMLVQTASFEATMQNELAYSIGADMRIESDPKPLNFNETLRHYPGVIASTPVIETWAQVGTTRFFLEAVDALDYMRIGTFSEQSFVGNDSTSVLTALDAQPNGIVISKFYSELWNKTIGNSILVYFGGENGTRIVSFMIVGLVLSAPGFGVASTEGFAGASFASQFGFQVGQGGFALVNLRFISEVGSLYMSKLTFVDATCYTDVQPMIVSLQQEKNLNVYTPQTFDVNTQSISIRLFLSGIQGLTTISYLLCTAMGLSAIALFLGSAVLERRSEYALFRALGGTQRQVISMVFGEFAGSVVAAISISVILGFFFGYAMSVLTFGISPFTPVLPEVLAYPFLMMLVTIAAESAVMLASCYIPAKRAGAVNPATALRNL
ncbi:MAG: FtsX-like permease family protein [Candidatus Thorarchaeota archaeon]